MKTAVLISGQMRTADRCLTSIVKHVLNRIGDHDVFINTSRDEDSWKSRLFKPLKSEIVEQPVLDDKNYMMRTGRGVIGVNQVLRMFWSMEESHRLMTEHMRETGTSYDWVIRLRSDTLFFTDLEDLSTLDPEAVYIPTFCNFWGYQDRFAVGGLRAMAAYHDKLSLLDTYIAQNGIFHPESILKWVLDRANIPVKRTSIEFDTLRPNGDHIRVSWNAAKGDVVPEWKKALEMATVDEEE